LPHQQALAGVTAATNDAKVKMTAMIGINDRFIFKTSARFRGGGGDHLLSTNEGVAAWFHSSCEAYRAARSLMPKTILN